MAKLQSTKNYAKFECAAFNREVKKTGALRKSMQKHGFIPAYPIHCETRPNAKLAIVGGHHRFEVAKELGLPVYYVVADGLDVTIHEMETATNRWAVSDYLHSFCALSMEPYLVVKEFHERTGITLNLCISMLGGDTAGSGNHTNAFKAGTYVVKDVEHAEIVGDITTFCTSAGVSFSSNSYFTQAISKMCRAEEFEPEIFKRRVSANPALMIRQPNVDAYMQLIEDVYNRLAKSKRLPLKFLADKAVSKRGAVSKKKAKKNPGGG